MSQSELVRQMLKPKKEWVKDSDVKHCFHCKKEFLPIVRWRHHCRFCGNVFCSKCVQNIMLGEQIDYKQQKRLRHCDSCQEKIKKKLAEQASQYEHKSETYDVNQNYFIEVQDLNETIITEEEENVSKCKVYIDKINQNMEQQIDIISKIICERHLLEVDTWAKRLGDLAMKTVNQVHIDTFARKEYFNVANEIRVLTIVTPKDSVTAVCVKGLILERNIPSKQLLTHLKYPNILTFKPAIQAQNLLQTNQARFDMIIKNQNATMKSYLQKIYRLQPNVIFVSEHVSKVAFEDFLENGIMVISKVKIEDLKVIERLTLIKKRIDNLTLIDKYRPTDVIGVCEKIYFKTIRKGEMLMFIEQEAGIRSVLLGDWNQEINGKLKSAFYQLLKIAWAFKSTRELAYKDVKFIGKECYSSLVLMEDVDWKRYGLEKNGFVMGVTGTKIVYRIRRFQDLPKTYQAYCLRLGHLSYLELCSENPHPNATGSKQNELDEQDFPKIFRSNYYQGSDLMLGTYLLSCLSCLKRPCRKCNSMHIERYFIDNHHVTVKWEINHPNKAHYVKFADSDEQQEVYERKQRNERIYDDIMRYLQNMKEKILFILYFRCQNCGEILNNSKIKLGKDYLSINLLHYLKELIHLYQQKGINCFPYEFRQKCYPCEHYNIVRIIQCHKAIVKFYVSQSNIYEISQIGFTEAIEKNMVKHDQRYITQIYKHEIEEKYLVIQDLQIQIMKMPFAVSTSTTFISSAPLHQHPFYQHFNKMRLLLQQMANHIVVIQASLAGDMGSLPHDWTRAMRQFYKIEYVLKIILEIIHFINHSLRKEKKSQSPSFDQNLTEDYDSHLRKDEFPQSPSPTRIHFTKFNSSQSITSIVSSIRKDTGVTEFDELDDIFRKSRKYRYPQYHGIHLYYPIGNTSDPVSLLACCLNSKELNERLKEPYYKDVVTCKMNFNKQLHTDWQPVQEVQKIYRQLLKEDYPKNEFYQYYFSIYYHREFEELRQSEGVNFNLYIRSLYGCQNWDSSGGKSNSTFSKSHNEVLVVKIINQKEFVEFQKFALAYLNYMKSKRENKDQSYLAKIYGIYEANIKGKIYKFVVMQNIFLGLAPPFKVYDLKGSQVNRLATPQGEKGYTGLDTNFIIDKDGKPYILDEKIYDKTIKTFEQDAIFLREQSVIDYSLLVIQKDRILRMGIIDFMRPYHFIEKIQTIYKQIKSGKNPTVIPPDKYAQRFISSLKKYFIKVPRNE